MNAAQAITVAGNACSLVITALLTAVGIIGVNFKERINRIFLAMILFAFAGGVFEIILSLMTNSQALTPDILAYAVDFADFACASCVIISFSFYMYELLARKSNLSKKPF